MGFNFPNSPSVGQKYPTPALPGAPVWQWDGSAWKTVGGQGLGGIYISDIVPAGAPDNSLWWESDTGNLYIRYNDGDSSQWVIVVPATSLTGLVRYDTSQSLTAAQQVQSRQNVYAAPFDAMSYSGMQFNGGMDVSQELGTTGRTTNGYTLDGWMTQFSGSTMVISSSQYTNLITGNGYPVDAALLASATVAQASMGANDYIMVRQPIEGYRVARLAWGSSTAQPITIGFYSGHGITGTHYGCVRNSASDRSYIFTYTQNTANIIEYKTVTIPGDTTGTWLRTNGVGMYVTFTLGSGTTYLNASTNQWIAGNYIAAPGVPNFAASTGVNFRLTGVVVLPGVEAPSAARSPLVMRPYDQELLTCQRYWEKLYGGGIGAGSAYAATGALISLRWLRKRAPPNSITTVNPGNFVLYTSNGGVLAITAANTSSYPCETGCVANYSVASGLVAGNGTQLASAAAGTDYIAVDARL